MLTALLGDGAELRTLKRLIIEKTEGNPFFIEETMQVAVRRRSAGPRRQQAYRSPRSLGDLKIPPTVQAILASRIDRLPAEREGPAADR